MWIRNKQGVGIAGNKIKDGLLYTSKRTFDLKNNFQVNPK